MRTNIIEYRFAVLTEAAALCAFGIQEFTRTFGHLYSAADLNDYLVDAYTEANYKRWIESDDFLVYVAYDTDTRTSNSKGDKVIAGYVLAGPCGLPLDTSLTLHTGDHHDADTKSLETASTLRDQLEARAKGIAAAGEIKRVYLHPTYFGSGIADKLMQYSIPWLRKDNSDRDIYLGVYSANTRAQRCYKKHGFVQVGEYSFPVGATVDREFIMKLEL